MGSLRANLIGKLRSKRPLVLLNRTVIATVIVAAALVPSFTDDQYVLDVMASAGLWVLLGYGLSVVVSLAGLLDLGYIAFWAIGAYTAALLASPRFDLHIPFLLIIPCAMAVTALFAVIIGFPTLRLRGDYLAIVTLGFGEIVRIALNNLTALTGGPTGVQSIDRPAVFGYEFEFQMEPYYYLVLVFCVLLGLCGEWLRRSSLGLAWQALRDDELAARSCGIHPLKFYLLAFAIGAMFASVSGVTFAMQQLAVSPDSFTVDQSFLVLAIVVLAGMSGRFLAVAVSGLILIAMPEALRGFDEYRLVVFGPVLVAVIIFREQRRNIVKYLGDLRSRRVARATPDVAAAKFDSQVLQ